MKFLEYMANVIINCVKMELNNYKGKPLDGRQTGFNYLSNNLVLLLLTCNNRMVLSLQFWY